MRYQVGIKLNDAGSIFPPGHRVRLAISTSYWPMIWPGPENATVTIFGGTLDLPVRPPNAADALLPPLPEPETAPPEQTTEVHQGVTRIDRIGHRTGHPGEFRVPHRRWTIRSALSSRCARPRPSPARRGGSGSRRRRACRARMTRLYCTRRCGHWKGMPKYAGANGTPA